LVLLKRRGLRGTFRSTAIVPNDLKSRGRLKLLSFPLSKRIEGQGDGDGEESKRRKD